MVTKNSFQGLVDKLKQYHQSTGVPYTPQTSVVSRLFPGQFNYCLDEQNLADKYPDLVHITEDEHFHKIQPAIRLADFFNQYSNQTTKTDHLGLFTLSTLSGCHVVPKEQGATFYEQAVQGVIAFLTETGLDPARLKITYFGGATAKDVEMSRKKPGQEGKVLADHYLEKDDLAEAAWVRSGLAKEQLAVVHTRDNFLTTNWDVMLGPWGYRNEILYQLKDGRWLDLGTIERLILYPTVEERPAPQGMAKYVTGVNPWNRTVIIDAVGLERLLLAIEDKQSIFETSLLQPLVDTGQTLQDIESVRMLHRIFTDATWDGLQSRQRKAKANKIMTAIDGLPPEKIKIPLQIPAEQYEYLFPELKNGIERASRTTC
jgi:alanyl-tRNA synthetase